MAKNPDDRYPSAGELARAAAAAVAGAGDYHRTAPTNVVGPDRATDVIRGWAPPPWGQPEKPTGTAKLAAGSRRHWKLLAAMVAVVIIAAAGAGVWAVTRPGPAAPTAAPSTPTAESKLVAHPTPTPTPTPTSAPASHLTPADVDLLKILPIGYGRANCFHMNPQMGADAVLGCEANPTVDNPVARYFHFPNGDAMTKAYKEIRDTFKATSCPGDPPGADASWSRSWLHDGKEAGRHACYMDPTVTPAAPGTVTTNYDPPVMATLAWTDAGGLDARNYFVTDGALVRDTPVDPDVFTPDDIALFKQLNESYTKTNCVHIDPPSPAMAALGCGGNLTTGAPGAQFFSYPNRDDAMVVYDSGTKLMTSPHRCGGAPGAGGDDPWISHNGKHIGRYVCLINGPEFENVPGLFASASETGFFNALFFADPPSSPYQLPKTEQALTDWFTNKFSA